MQEMQDFEDADPSKLSEAQTLASLIVDALIDGGLIKKEQVELAEKIVEEEINVRNLR